MKMWRRIKVDALVEVAGFALIVAAVFYAFGMAPALATAGGIALMVSYGMKP